MKEAVYDILIRDADGNIFNWKASSTSKRRGGDSRRWRAVPGNESNALEAKHPRRLDETDGY